MSFWSHLLGVPFTVGQVYAREVATRRLKTGAGDPVLCLHGISGHLEMFLPMIPYFRQKVELHLIDMLGHGFTAKMAQPVTTDRLAAHACDYLDAAGIAQAHVIGISLGGWTAAWLASSYPDRVKSLILVAAAGDPNGGPAANPAIGASIRSTTAAGVMSDDREMTKQRLQQVIANPARLEIEMVDVRYRIYHEAAFRANLEALMALTYPETYREFALTGERLRRILCQTLIVYGDEDKSSGASPGQFLLDAIPRARRIIFEETGHWPPYEQPAKFAELALQFIAGGLEALPKM